MLDEITKDLTVDNKLGKCTAYTYSVEFQKRGLPHAHMIIWFREDSQIRNSMDVDDIVMGRLPPENVPELREMVAKFMSHKCTPKCKPDGTSSCKDGFPKDLCEETCYVEGEFKPTLFRPADSYSYQQGRQTVTVTNADIVAYNQYLTYKYKCHINVEVISSGLHTIKYL
jgi:Helitron helicase-like domain at N-terminus